MNILMRALPNIISARAGRAALIGAKHAPTILFAGGVVGVVATAVTASKATLKLEDILVEGEINLNRAKEAKALDREDYTEEDYNKDRVIIYSKTTITIVKLYAPTIAIGILTIAALTKSHRMLTSRNAALAAAYTVLEKGFNEYRARVTEELGRDVDDHFRYGSNLELDVKEKGKNLPNFRVGPQIPSIYARFFDPLCEAWVKEPEYNLTFLRCQQNYLNDLLHARGHVFLNEAYDRLGIPRTKEGQAVGWLKNGEGDNFIDFGIFNGDNEKARDFVNGREGAILLDFNVDGTIYDKI